VRYLFAGLLWLSAGIGAGFAGELEMSPPRQVVRIGDLNLNDSRGIAAAYVRLLGPQSACARSQTPRIIGSR